MDKVDIFRNVTSNVLNDVKTKKVIKATMDLVYEVMSTTLGPYGSNIIISDNRLQHFCTKDGYTVLRNMAIDGYLSRVILNFLQRVSSKLNRTVGDGTTTAIIVARNLYEALSDTKAYKEASPRIFSKMLEKAVQGIEEQLKKLAFNPDKSDIEKWEKIIYNVAYTSSNGDADVAQLISDAYKVVTFDGTISVEESVAAGVVEDSISYSSGFELYCGCDIETYQTDTERQIFNVSGDVYVLMSKVPMLSEYISPFATLLSIIQKKEGSLVIIAPGFDSNFVDFFRINKQRMPELMICPVSYSANSKEQKDTIDDLRLFFGMDKNDVFGATDFDDNSFQKFMSRHGTLESFGKCDTALIFQNKAIFMGGKGAVSNEIRLTERRTELLTALQKVASDDYYINRGDEIATLRKRVHNISENSTAKISVGGKTPQEVHTRFYLIEDAVSACRSALRFGVGFGCNYTVYRAIRHYFWEIYGKVDEPIGYNYTEKKFGLRLETDEQAQQEAEIICAILNSYVGSISKILENAGKDSLSYRLDTAIKAFEEQEVYNLNTRESISEQELISYYMNKNENNWEENQIPPLNSIETDIEILRTAMSIISLLLTSKNFISSESLMDNTEGLKTNESMIRH